MKIVESRNIRTERFDRITFPDQLYKLNRSDRGLSLGDDKNISAFDFEVLTKDGQTVPAMLGYATFNSEEQRVSEQGIVQKDLTRNKNRSKKYRKDLYKLVLEGDRTAALDSFLKEMSKRKYKDNLNFFYNIKYDMSILLSLLPDDKLQEVYDFNECDYKDYTISIIPKKLLFITRKDVKREYTTAFYDLASLTKQSLDNACKSWLNKGKQDFDTAEVFNDFELFKEEYGSGNMQKYCIKDCTLTTELANAVREHFNNINVPFSRPTSPASLSKDYIKFNNLPYPNFKYKKLQRLCYSTYYGGLFEFYKRGKFENAKGYDVDSLYPSVMVDLPNLEDCDIFYSKEYNKKSDWAVIKARVWLDPEGKIMPFSMKSKISYRNEKGKKKQSEKVIRPVLRGQEVILSKQMYEFLVNGSYPYLEKIEVEFAYNIFEDQDTRRPFGYLQDLFNTRVDLIKKYGKKDKRQEVIKVMLNSPYGATAEVIQKPDIEEIDGRKYLTGTEFAAGDLFRPFLAFHITELSRLKMYQNIFDCGIEDNVIAVATDCIYIDQEGQEKFENYGDITNKKELGTFSIDYKGDMLAIGNGIYFFEKFKNIKIKPKTKYGQQINIKVPGVKKTTRGFNENKVPDLMHTEKYDQDQKINIVNNRPLGFKEVLYFHSGKKELIGKFTDELKKLNLNMDKSRIWDRKVKNLSDLKNSVINSQPLQLSEIKSIKLTDGNIMYYNEEKEEKEVDLLMDKDFEKIEKFKNAMILLDKDGEEFVRNKDKMSNGQWITWNNRKVLIYNDSIAGGDIPPEWQGFSFDDDPFIQNEEREDLRELILYFLSLREDMLQDQLQVLKTELKQGVNPQTIINYDNQGFMNYERSPSMNPKWFVEPDSYYNWYSLKSSLTKKRVLGQIEKKNENSQLYQDLKFLAHKILLEGDPVRNYPPEEEYQDLHAALLEQIEEIKEVR
jgi:hypothetical protein